MEHPPLSIIVPVYNTASFLVRCLNSILNQTFDKWELILADDGSTDGSGAICDSYSQQYPEKIKVLHLEHAGQGAARNAGLDIARGEYVAFVDSDDYILPEMYKKLMSIAIENDSDAVLCDVNFKRGNQTIIQKCVPDGHFSVADHFRRGYHYTSSCNRVFKQRLFSTRRFAHMLYEDAALVPVIISHCDKVNYVQEALYCYCYRSGSSSHDYTDPRTLEMLPAFEMAIHDCNPSVKNELICATVNELLHSISGDRAIYAAEIITFIQRLRPTIEACKYIMEDLELRKVYNYFQVKFPIPSRIISANFGHITLTDTEMVCVESWRRFAPGYEIVILNESNNDIHNAPKVVIDAWNRGDFDFVNDYYRLCHTYENGGVAIDLNVVLRASLGRLRVDRAFFGYRNAQDVSPGVFGAEKGHPLLARIMQGYRYSGISEFKYGQILTDNVQPLWEKLSVVLRKEYPGRSGLETGQVKNSVALYAPETFTYPVSAQVGVAHIYTSQTQSLQQDGLVPVDFDYLQGILKSGVGIETTNCFLRTLTVPEHPNTNQEHNLPMWFSIVIELSTVGAGLKQTLDNVIYQDIGFEKNVQIILLGADLEPWMAELVKDYATRCPKNILHIPQNMDNLNVKDLQASLKGRYILFYLSTVYWPQNTLLKTKVLFESNSGRMLVTLLQNKKGEQQSPTSIISVNKNIHPLLSQTCAYFIKTEAWIHEVSMTKVSNTSPLAIIISLLLEKPWLGIVRVPLEFDGCQTGISITETVFNKREVMLNFWSEFLTKKIQVIMSTKKNPSPFFQMLIVTMIFQVIKHNGQIMELLEQEDIGHLKQSFHELLSYVDSKHIIDQKMPGYYNEHRIYLLELKKRSPLDIKSDGQQTSLIGDSGIIANLGQLPVKLEFATYEDSVLTLEGSVVYYGVNNADDISLLANINGDIFPCCWVERGLNRHCLDDVFLQNSGFQIKIPISDDVELYQITFISLYRGHWVNHTAFRFGQFFPLEEKVHSSYFINRNRILTFENNTFLFRKCGIKGKILYEYHFLRELMDNKVPQRKEIAVLRVLAKIIRPLIKKPIWILSDRMTSGGDNAESFFRYLNQNPCGKKTYFILKKGCEDVGRIRKVGKVVDYMSFQHKLRYLLSSRSISSQSNDYVIFPFGYNYRYFKDITIFSKFVFLQHGITQNDLSDWLQRYNRNIEYFITAARPEYDSILFYPYHYTKKQVLLTGFARFDELYQAEERLVAFVPTWRKYLYEKYNSDIEKAIKRDGFTDTKYFQFYNALLNDQRLRDAAQRTNYKLAFMCHPNVRPYLDEFKDASHVLFFDADTQYKDLYAKSNLMITDYSSVVFDFAYLHKPVLYAQFDRDEFFSGEHSLKQGYYDYEQDGFGEVEYDLDSTLNRIIEYMENGCVMKDFYLDRVQRFFAFTDKNNCERIYQEICEESY